MKKQKIYKANSLVAAIYCGTIASNGDIESWIRLRLRIIGYMPIMPKTQNSRQQKSMREIMR